MMDELYNFCDPFLVMLEECRDDGTFCDFKLACKERSIDVHKIVISAHSPVFKAACSGSFKESADRVYEITDADFSAVEQMVAYMYTGDYDVPEYDVKGPPEKEDYVVDFVFHIRMYSLAKKYMIRPLEMVAMDLFKLCFCQTMDIDSVLASIPELYDARTCDELSKMDFVHKHVADLLGRFTGISFVEGWLDNRRLLTESVGKVPLFGVHLIEALIKERQPGPRLTTFTGMYDVKGWLDNRQLLTKVAGKGPLFGVHMIEALIKERHPGPRLTT